jgi:hypothetical protein
LPFSQTPATRQTKYFPKVTTDISPHVLKSGFMTLLLPVSCTYRVAERSSMKQTEMDNKEDSIIIGLVLLYLQKI